MVFILSEVPRLLNEIVWDAEAAVNLNHTSKVVVAVAPPHAPVGAAFVAFCILAVVDTQARAGTKAVAPAQLSFTGCAKATKGRLKKKSKTILLYGVYTCKNFFISVD